MIIGEMIIGEPGWYYTLSAIPQTLAAMIALAATFIIFKLTYVKQTIREDLLLAKWFLLAVEPGRYGAIILKMSKRSIAREFIKQTRAMNKEIAAGTLSKERWHVLWDEFSDVVEGSYRHFASHPEKIALFLEQKASSLENNVVSGQRIFSYLRRSIFFTAIPIVFSLLFLPLYGLVSGSLIIVGFAVLLAVWAVIFTSYSVLKISPI